jgi:methylated-DNA-[protein]-cysteine S-methyltransferase
MKPARLEAQTRVASPLGPLTLAATAQGLALVWFDGQAHRSESVDAPEAPDHPHLALAAQELERYWQQPRAAFTVPLDPQGTPFQHAVWRILRGIAPGALCSYGDIARQVQRPGAALPSRAVGAAVGRNPLGIIVPCHRVVGTGGALTGYAGGLQRKQALLALEGARPSAAHRSGVTKELFV